MRLSLKLVVLDESPTVDGTGRFSTFEHGLISWTLSEGPTVKPEQPHDQGSPTKAQARGSAALMITEGLLLYLPPRRWNT